jgi:hypothetical protein
MDSADHPLDHVGRAVQDHVDGLLEPSGAQLVTRIIQETETTAEHAAVLALHGLLRKAPGIAGAILPLAAACAQSEAAR